MPFIGVIANQKDFTLLKSKILENVNISSNINIININNRSVANVKNIKFETLIICENSEVINNNTRSINLICKNIKYLIVNSDISIDLSNINSNNFKIITYGLNRNAMITVSSIQEDKILVAQQNNLKDLYGKTIEMGETNIALEEENKMKVYHILILYVIFVLYNEEKHVNEGKICFF